jgi:hypothetical protein
MPYSSPHDPPAPATPRRDRLRAASVGLAVAGHLAAAVVAVLLIRPEAPPPAEAVVRVIPVVEPPPPPPPPPKPEPSPKPDPGGSPPAAAKPAPIKPDPPKTASRGVTRRTPKPPPKVQPTLVADDETVDAAPDLSEADLAGAARAGSGSGRGGSGGGAGTGEGGGGRDCDMVGLLQRALRSDPDIQAAAASAYRLTGKPILVWNGDWLRDRRQEGKGLAGVRQAIAAEVAFAPKVCRSQPVRGLVLISMREGPGAPRLVLGSTSWRWSDLQFTR